MKIGGRNELKSKTNDWPNRTGSTFFGGVGEGGGSTSEKQKKKWGICNLRTVDQILMKFDI